MALIARRCARITRRTTRAAERAAGDDVRNPPASGNGERHIDAIESTTETPMASVRNDITIDAPADTVWTALQTSRLCIDASPGAFSPIPRRTVRACVSSLSRMARARETLVALDAGDAGWPMRSSGAAPPLQRVDSGHPHKRDADRCRVEWIIDLMQRRARRLCTRPDEAGRHRHGAHARSRLVSGTIQVWWPPGREARGPTGRR